MYNMTGIILEKLNYTSIKIFKCKNGVSLLCSRDFPKQKTNQIKPNPLDSVI